MNLQENISLKKFNTFGIDVSAKYFLEANSASDIQNFLDDKSSPLIKGARGLLVLGGGSNILFTKNFDGTVLKNNLKGIELLKEDSESYFVKAGGGEVWHEFVLHCIKNNYAGVENLSLIPGSVGAAPIQNIGAYGVEQKEVFQELEAINLEENKKVVFKNSDCQFGYRDSIFKREAKNKFIITSVTFILNKKPKLNTSYGAINQELEKMGVKEISISAISQAVCNIRRSKLPDPAVIGNAGSFFKNPTVSAEKYNSLKNDYPSVVAYPSPNGGGQGGGFKLAAGWLIEQCGWKGKQFGSYGVHPVGNEKPSYGVHKDQALVLVNYGGANGKEIYELSGKVLQSVIEKFGVVLEREVVIV
ncbi:MAG: UDP-N-acetylmuramate dehydrogenase [Bacteroidetes bacterium]|nr:UDP-N-acetylmuramate dehydrogenase [Bacteroidota bacterium]